MVALRVAARFLDEGVIPPLPAVNDISAMWEASISQWATSIQTTLKTSLGRTVDSWVNGSLELALSQIEFSAEEDGKFASVVIARAKSSIQHAARKAFSIHPLPEEASDASPDTESRVASISSPVKLPPESLADILSQSISKRAQGASTSSKTKISAETVKRIVSRITASAVECVEELIRRRNVAICASATSPTKDTTMSNYTKRGRGSRNREAGMLYDAARRDLAVQKEKKKEEKTKAKETDASRATRKAKGHDGLLGVSLSKVVGDPGDS